MKKALLQLLVILGLAAIDCEGAHAARQYRCNGMIQYRPCLAESATPRAGFRALEQAQRKAIISARHGSAVPATASNFTFAKIVKASYKRLSSVSGQWRGIVEGNGNIKLTLHIIRNGAIESTRFMGQIALRNKKTSFNFVSAPPAGKGWTYTIIAAAS
ncbi:MAG: hypothetical protein J5J00_15510 [Deltaproteobacteria bacterium]|nr:hypothetical protein [Deltaproteobacteria bacterium]